MDIPKQTLDKLAPYVADTILERAYHEWQEYFVTGYFEVDLNAELWKQVEAMGRSERLSKKLVEALEQHPQFRRLSDEIEEVAREQLEDARYWHQSQRSIYAMARYHGVSVADWI
ncbi:hypothetical protein D3P09_02480 [Paenibacillus pinisoli]|uniref:Uncharacterized protein n=1 Tax=Paenibacillus pinisoli TaxID=1276110 RepID=A0A3A6PIF0_9BACL|nr:hypothetical protein [Paenibacillus pinisoli]RJX40905.1 hypothetical protein D3P09_02480 [Paenibacillus pinisoli]